MTAPSPRGFVCVVNRNRDDYQVPLALFEAGLLDRFVTDFYAGGLPDRIVPARLRHRKNPGLPRRVTKSAGTSFLIQTVAQVAGASMARIFRVTNALLALSAGVAARRHGSHLYAYAEYMPPDWMIPSRARRISFAFHPSPALVRTILTQDLARFPQVAWSYAHEAETRTDVGVGDESWRRADAVVCASAMTRRSLEHAGCDPARITVIPYGFDATHTAPAIGDGSATPDPPLPPTRGCRFLFVGQGIQRKGLHHLIAAWQSAAPPGAHLTIVSYRIDPGIRAMIDSDTITFLGRRTAAELDALYRAADVFVMPSLVEGFGLVYLEALARGCFVIGTENTGLPDLALAATAAAIVPAGDIAALSAGMIRAAEAHRFGRLDRTAIMAEAGRWQWTDFRRAIADHARATLAAPHAFSEGPAR